MTREEAFDKLLFLGAAKATVDYSGGGDEGGVDDIEILDPNDDVLYVIFENATADAPPFEGAEELAEALSEPVDKQHGGFDGSGLDGTITWDVASRRVMDRPSYEEFVEYGPFVV